MTNSHVHCHVHSEFSMLDGAAKLTPLFTEASRLGMPALAITDHGNMFGAAEFYRTSQKYPDVKPIIGVEAYLAPTSRHHKAPVFWGHSGQRNSDTVTGEGGDVSGNGAYAHMTLLAENATGLRNLFRLSSLASIEGYYRKPRMDRELIARHAEGIIATTGCPSGEVQTRLRLGQYPEALQSAADYRDIFGPGNFYLELMDHGLSIERSVREALLRIGRELNLQPLATNDSHYVTKDQAGAHDALLCIQVGKTISDPDRFRFDGDGYHLKSAQEMRAYWDTEVPGACDATLAIAQRVESYAEVFANVDRKPRVPLEPGDSEGAALRREVDQGIARRFPNGLPPGYQERTDMELGVIIGQGFPGYFLAIVDLIQWAAEQDIFCRARGSACGSLALYLMGVTDMDPMVHGLFFERFLNPDRVSPPDVDLDVDQRYRDRCITYLSDRWGAENVARVITFGTIKTKAAIKDATRVLGHSYAAGEKLTKALPPPIRAEDAPLSAVTDPSHARYAECAAIRAMVESDTRAEQIVATAKGLEGLIRNASVHACGVFLSSEPLLDVIPMWMREDGALITGWDWSACEDVGLSKFDVLSSDTNAVLMDTVAAVKATHGIEINLPSLPLDDPATYDLLASGHALGVFQMEGAGARELLRRIRPTCFPDICATTALYRPGPMETNTHNEYADRKNGLKPVIPIHPELSDALSDVLSGTYGLCCYQEDVMAIARKVAGYTLGQADLLRRAMGKKKPEVLAAESVRFRDGMTANGFSPAAIKALWDTLLPFSGYAFVRCIDGDTEVWLGGSGSDSNGKTTIQELYNRLHVNLLPPRRRLKWDPPPYGGPCLHCKRVDRPAVWRGRCGACRSWWTKFRNTGLTALSLDKDGRIRPRRIRDVHHNGVRECWRVTLEDGRSIVSTADHRHMTSDGWKRVGDLTIGDSLLVVGDDYAERHREYVKYDERLTVGEPSYRGARVPNWDRNGELSLGYINGGAMRLKQWTETQEWVCQSPNCSRSKAQGDTIQRAHLDGNRRNNDPLNLRMLCVQHHLAWDYKHNARAGRFQTGKPATPVVIISIESVGDREVYDLEMDAPHARKDGIERSWVGNGIVTHNSHAASYGLVSYWTAYLKAHYPSEFMAARLSSVSDKKERTAIYLAECRRMGIKILPPDVNDSALHFAATPAGIRFGLGSVRNVGENVVAAIIRARELSGRFASFPDFLSKADATCCNKQMLASLIKAGAFDSLGHPRCALFDVHAEAVDMALGKKKQEAQGQFDLFGGGDASVPIAVSLGAQEWPQAALLAHERDQLGCYVSAHPLDAAVAMLRRRAPRSVGECLADPPTEGEKITVAGLVTAVGLKTVKQNGKRWAIVTVEDVDGEVECRFLSRAYEVYGPALEVDTVVTVTGQVGDGEGVLRILADGLTVLDLSDAEIDSDMESMPALDVPSSRGSIMHGDNLLIMESLIPSHKESIDFIYIDPPYNSNANYGTYTDKWSSMNAYIDMLRPRISLMRDLLSPTGSICVHVDWHASHHVRMLMDELFGSDNLINEIIWRYGKMSNAKRRFPQNHDTLFLYSRTSEYHFVPIRAADSEYRNRFIRHLTGNQLLYGTVKSSADKLIQMRVRKVSKELGRDLTDTDVLFDFDTECKVQDDVFYDISIVKGNAGEQEHFDTQKPEKLIERMIEACCPRDGMVADFFAGSGTTAAVAHKLGRTWITADISPQAVAITQSRLAKMGAVMQVQSAQVSAMVKPLTVTLPIKMCTQEIVAGIKSALTCHPGDREVRLLLVNGAREHLMYIDDSLRVSSAPALIVELRSLLGPDCVVTE